MTERRMPRVLVVAGSDSGGGAGVQADIKTITMLGGYAASAITAVTVQNTERVYAVHPVPPAIVGEQISVVLSDIGADAVKIGMLGSADTVAAVADALTDFDGPIVLDPVMVATSGDSLIRADAEQSLKTRLIPLASLITPNLPEAERLLGAEITEPEDAAKALYATFGVPVLLKGGHAEGGNEITDRLAGDTGVRTFLHPRIDSRSTHGTGCTLASAIATGLARGTRMDISVQKAIAFVSAAIAAAPGFGAGHGPMGHANVREAG